MPLLTERIIQISQVIQTAIGDCQTWIWIWYPCSGKSLCEFCQHFWYIELLLGSAQTGADSFQLRGNKHILITMTISFPLSFIFFCTLQPKSSLLSLLANHFTPPDDFSTHAHAHLDSWTRQTGALWENTLHTQILKSCCGQISDQHKNTISSLSKVDFNLFQLKVKIDAYYLQLSSQRQSIPSFSAILYLQKDRMWQPYSFDVTLTM